VTSIVAVRGVFVGASHTRSSVPPRHSSEVFAFPPSPAR
jgi:hypothetical protein